MCLQYKKGRLKNYLPIYLESIDSIDNYISIALSSLPPLFLFNRDVFQLYFQENVDCEISFMC